MEALKCPNCGSSRKFGITAYSVVEIEGSTGYVEDHYGFEWDKDTECVCHDCQYSAEYSQFVDNYRGVQKQ